MGEKDSKNNDDRREVFEYIKQNQPVTQVELRNNFNEKVILSLRRLMSDDMVTYDDKYAIVTTDTTK